MWRSPTFAINPADAKSAISRAHYFIGDGVDLPITLDVALIPYDTDLRIKFLIKNIEDICKDRFIFDWVFGSRALFHKLMEDVIKASWNPNCKYKMPDIQSDSSRNSVEFVSPTMFDMQYFKETIRGELLDYTAELLRYRATMVQELIQHPIYVAHMLAEAPEVRFKVFKNARANHTELVDYFDKFVGAIIMIDDCVPTCDYIEQGIGCHFLDCPDLYRELVSIAILKGTIINE